MQQPTPFDERVRIWTLQRQLVRASLSSPARGHVVAPPRPRPVRPAPRRGSAPEQPPR
jgi:hypothetical protein